MKKKINDWLWSHMPHGLAAGVVMTVGLASLLLWPVDIAIRLHESHYALTVNQVGLWKSDGRTVWLDAVASRALGVAADSVSLEAWQEIFRPDAPASDVVVCKPGSFTALLFRAGGSEKGYVLQSRREGNIVTGTVMPVPEAPDYPNPFLSQGGAGGS